ncbi:MAG: hypothetical protein ABFD50_06255 [Smithella sp.]
METKQNFYDLETIRTEIFSETLSKAFIYELVKQGKIKSIRIGRRILVSTEEAQRLLSEGIK